MILLAAILTVTIESAFFAAILGLKKLTSNRSPLCARLFRFEFSCSRKLFFLYWALVNLFTNLLLNLSLQTAVLVGAPLSAVNIAVYPAEVLVVIAEWLFLSVICKQKGYLLILVFLSNLLSYSLGLLLL
ncbi:MAG: hypothetical protein IJC94_07745 [Oscillospiraceae bacterium]|nr:hypothetical protein [Oscillospiraceae bacterium]